MGSKHNDITYVIKTFYEVIHHRKPDSAEYKAEYKALEVLMYPKEDWLRGYTAEEVINTVNWLVKSGVVVRTLKILYFEHVLSSFVDNDYMMQEYIIKKLKFLQAKDGIADMDYNINKPDGW